MKKISFILLTAVCLLFIGCSKGNRKRPTCLKDAFQEKFYIGAALNHNQFTGADEAAVKVIQKHFNAIVAENCMKSEVVQPEEGRFDFADADRFVTFGMDNHLFITGHTLIWHSQAPAWFFKDEKGNDVSREVLIERMRTHITTVVSRYKGLIHGWDVVNEAILDDGSFRPSKFYEIIGEEYIQLAFKFASQADPEAELYYNDYSMAHAGKRQGVVNMVKSLQAQGVKIDGIGMQGHLSMDFPAVEEFEKSLTAFAALGVKVMITELDLSVLPSPRRDVGADVASTYEYQKEMNPYTEGMPAELETAWTNRYLDFFKLFLKHQDKISRVTLWGVSDGDSWKNDWPIRGRKDYPLLFDRNHEPKPLVKLIMNESFKSK